MKRSPDTLWSDMKTCFIINPRSGRNGNGAATVAEVRRFVKARGLEARIVFTERARHAIELAGAAVDDGCELVVACGGDGTINEIAQKLTGTGVCFGILPSGSGNGLARHLRIPRSVGPALEVLVSGETRAIDTGLADGRPFINVMGMGFDAVISERFNSSEQRGFISYLKTVLTSYKNHTSSTYETTSDGETETMEACLVAVANSSQYGSNALIAPDAELSDGKLNFVAVGAHRYWDLPVLAARLFAGSLDRHPRVVTRMSSHFVIRRATSGLIHVDGEAHMAGAEVEIRVLPNSLLVRTPSINPRADAGK